MYNNYLIGIVIGCFVTFVCCQFLPRKKKQSTFDYKEIERRIGIVEFQTSRNKFASERNTERIEAVENRQDRADEWFGSVIRHSRAQFDKEAVETFLKEQGLEEEE